MKMKLCVASLFTVLSVGSVWADTPPSTPAPAATNGAIIDQGGNLHYQSQGATTNGQPPAQPTGGAAPPIPSQEQLNQKLDQVQQQQQQQQQQNMQQQQPQQQPMPTPDTPGMSATQPTPSAH